VWWLLPLGMLTWAAIILLGYRSLIARAPRIRVPLRILVLVLLVPVTASVARRAASSFAEYSTSSGAIVHLSHAAERNLKGRHDLVLGRTGGYLVKGAIQAGMMAYLDHHGVRVFVPSPRSDGGRLAPLQFPPDRVSHEDQGKVAMLVSGREALLDPPGRLIATSDPLSRHDRRAWLADYRVVRDVLVSNHRRDLVDTLTLADVGLALIEGPPELGTVKGAIDELQRFNGRGPVNLLWIVKPGTR
jgi:hypothetical protein